MAIGANSYGDTGQIAALTPRYANGSGVFDGTTRPTLTTVETNVDQVSAMLNVMLSSKGFSIPITDTDAKAMCSFFVNEEVAAIVEGINGNGRFGPGQKQVGRSRYALITADVQEFVDANADGIERIGATRTYSLMDEIGFRDTDNAGDATFPIFQRKQFGIGETFTDDDQ